MEKKFEEIYGIDVTEKIEKKNGLNYLSWACAWAEFKKVYPDATYKIKMFENNLPYVYDEKTGYMVFTEVTAGGLTYEMWLPVMNNSNKTLLEAKMFDINKTIMRCLTKNLAMFGLGLYIYEGEDLPEAPEEPKEPLNEELVAEFISLGGTLEIAADYYKTDVESLANEQIKVLVDRKKQSLAKAKQKEAEQATEAEPTPEPEQTTEATEVPKDVEI